MTSIDLKDPDLYRAGDPHAAFADLRRREPVYWNPEADGPGFWAITKYEDIAAISKDPRTFSSARDWGGHRIFDERAVTTGSEVDASMISMDPPEHNAYRRMVAPGFVPRRIDALERGVERRVTDILDRLRGRETVEFVSAVAAELPIQVLAELFDVPDADRAKLFEWSNAVIGEDDPDLRADEAYIQGQMGAMAAYALGLWQARLAQPGEDLISMLVHARVDGEPMTMQRYLGTFILLVVAGNETTRNSISGGLVALAEHPDQRAALLANPALLPRAVSEIIRWVSPVLHMRRTATEDVSLRGKTIKRGDKVVMWYVSGNRDETAFDRPDQFDVARAGPAHLSFGLGQHFCLGSRLAEVQLRLLFQTLLNRHPDIAPIAPPRRLRSNFINGIKSLDVRLG